MRIAITIVLAALAGCGGFGRVNQGRVVEYQHGQGLITLVADSNHGDPAHPRYDVLPAVTIRTPEDPREMGPPPEPGKLLDFDTGNRRVVIYDSATRALRAIPYTLIAEQDHVAAGDARVTHTRFPVVDRAKGTITVYRPRHHKLIEFSVAEEYRNLPGDTWKAGDEVRYYYKNPGRALRLMNVSKTDLNKADK